jgi:CRISPR-associated protein Cmr6
VLIPPVPKAVRELLGQNTHPGLLLDKYVPSWDEQMQGKLSERVQKPAVDDIVRLSRQGPGGLDWDDLWRRRRAWLEAVGARLMTCETAGPLTLHLARASALENAGLCLHPVYGFTYLPGSGLKGLARAYTETVARAPDADVLAVFGNKPGEPDGNRQSAGAVVFHDTWPTQWPRLVADIVNNHHTEYYGAPVDDTAHPPGDWEEPSMVSFLAVPAGVTFEFALAKRRTDVPDRLLNLAREWLIGGLTRLGAGAKTAAGYGHFRPVADCPELSALPSTLAEFSATVELVTPAFLAGPHPDQGADDCDLRPATLRGLLRWWWRTLHAGYVDVATLRRLEADVWGDTKAGGAVRVVIEPQNRTNVWLYGHPQGLPGVRYLAYGMDEKSKGVRRQRHLRDAGSTWTVRLTARPVYESGTERIKISAQAVLEQARAALWLLCHWGGAGSKARKGFGSLQANPEFSGSLDEAGCLQVAQSLRDRLGLGNEFTAGHATSSALGDPDRQTLAEEMPTQDEAAAHDLIGTTYQAVAQAFKHRPDKAAWGLPRKIHGPREDGPLTARDGRPLQRDWQRPEWLDFPKRDRTTRRENARHASPIHLHLARDPGGRLTIRMIGFPANFLPDRATSVRMLQEFFARFRRELAERQPAPPRNATGRADTGPRAALRPSAAAPARTPVTVTVLERRDAGGRTSFLVQEEGKPRGVLGYGTPPPTLPEVGQTVEVYVNNPGQRNPQYRWDPPSPPPQPTRGPRGPRPGG